MSIPRDSLGGHPRPRRGPDRHASTRSGGPALLIQTVEGLTALRLRPLRGHRLRRLPVDGRRRGGIDVDGRRPPLRAVPAPARRPPERRAGAGLRPRHRYGVPRRGPRPAERQQNALRAILMPRSPRHGTLSRSGRGSTTSWTPRAARWASTTRSATAACGHWRSDLNDLGPGRSFPACPGRSCGGREQFVVPLDTRALRRALGRVRAERVAAYAGSHPADALGPVMR